jgi:hypothetical protein
MPSDARRKGVIDPTALQQPSTQRRVPMEAVLHSGAAVGRRRKIFGESGRWHRLSEER